MGAPKGNKYAVGNPGGGRPSLYKPEYAERAELACRAGFTDREMASLFGVCELTINDWKLAHKEFSLALKLGKSEADNRVERSLYNRAVGYTYTAEKVVVAGGIPQNVTYTEHVLPDTTAAIFFLKNRRPADWRDVHKHEVGRAGEFSEIPDAQLLALIQEEAEAIGEELVTTNQGTGSVN